MTTTGITEGMRSLSPILHPGFVQYNCDILHTNESSNFYLYNGLIRAGHSVLMFNDNGKVIMRWFDWNGGPHQVIGDISKLQSIYSVSSTIGVTEAQFFFDHRNRLFDVALDPHRLMSYGMTNDLFGKLCDVIKPSCTVAGKDLCVISAPFVVRPIIDKYFTDGHCSSVYLYKS